MVAFSLQTVMAELIIRRMANIGGVKIMAVHHGGKVGKAGRILATKSSSKSAKRKAGTTLANHKAKNH